MLYSLSLMTTIGQARDRLIVKTPVGHLGSEIMKLKEHISKGENVEGTGTLLNMLNSYKIFQSSSDILIILPFHFLLYQGHKVSIRPTGLLLF